MAEQEKQEFQVKVVTKPHPLQLGNWIASILALVLTAVQGYAGVSGTLQGWQSILLTGIVIVLIGISLLVKVQPPSIDWFLTLDKLATKRVEFENLVRNLSNHPIGKTRIQFLARLYEARVREILRLALAEDKMAVAEDIRNEITELRTRFGIP